MELENNISDLIQNLATGFEELKGKFANLCEKNRTQNKENEAKQNADTPSQPIDISIKLFDRLDQLESKLEELEKINFKTQVHGKFTEFPKWFNSQYIRNQLKSVQKNQLKPEVQEIQSLKFNYAKEIMKCYEYADEEYDDDEQIPMMLIIPQNLSNKDIIQLGKELEQKFGPVYLYLHPNNTNKKKKIKLDEFNPMLHKCKSYYFVID